MREISLDSIPAIVAANLGLRSGQYRYDSAEMIAATLRRVAGFMCPCAPRRLVQSLVDAADSLVSDGPAFESHVQDVLDSMIGYGDLIEAKDWQNDSQASRTVLYAGPPGFVPRASGAYILFGIVPDRISSLPEELESRIEYAGHIRRIRQMIGENLRGDLRDLGLIELSSEAWLRVPRCSTPDQHIGRFNLMLDQSSYAGSLEGLMVLDPMRPVSYYRGRWTTVKRQTGRFIGRRPRPYGADLWCYVELRDGQPSRVLDLPAQDGEYRGCDEAWQLQAALDAVRGVPQQMRLRAGANGNSLLQFFSPVPSWAQRRLDVVGRPQPQTAGSLFSYSVSNDEVEQEKEFLRSCLWLDISPA